MTWLYLGLIVAQSFDMGTTALRLHQGCREAVWPTQSPTVMIAAKSTGVVGTILLGKRGRKKLALTIALAGIASGTYGAAHNWHVSCTTGQ